MQRTRWSTILACFTGAAVLTWIALDLVLRHHGWVPALTIWGAAVAVVTGAVVLAAGLAVRRLRDGRPTWIRPTGAATVAAAAQASALVGAIVGGVYGGELALALIAPNSPAMSNLTWSATVCLVAFLAWCGIGLLVEHWCALKEDDDDPDSPGAAGRSAGGSQPSGAAARHSEGR